MLASSDRRLTPPISRQSPAQLLRLGERQLAYVRIGLHEGEPIFVLYGADGCPIVMIERIEQVAQAARHLGLELSAVH